MDDETVENEKSDAVYTELTVCDQLDFEGHEVIILENVSLDVSIQAEDVIMEIDQELENNQEVENIASISFETLEAGREDLKTPNEEDYEDSGSSYQPSSNGDSTNDDSTNEDFLNNVCNQKATKKTPADPDSLPYTRKKKAERKQNRNFGLGYKTALGKVVPARAPKKLGKCRNDCKEKISEDNIQVIHNEYWALGDRDKRVAFIASMVETKSTVTSRKRDVPKEKEKSLTVTHSFHLKVNGERLKVCRGCFVKILNETNMFISLSIKNSRESVSGTIQCDKRGLTPPANKHSEEKINAVINHINSFPLYESHYTRRESARKYLPPHLNLQILFRLYCEGRQDCVSRPIFEREFHKLKISFKEPKVDTCHKCDTLALRKKLAIDCDKEEIENEIAAHHAAADEAYLEKDKIKQIAKAENEVLAYTFDLQQCLPTPFVNSSVSFYKRQLWTFNLTMHESGSGDVKCYMWHEAEGGRGGNQIATCVFKELCSLPPHIKKVVLFSDTCGGQNKNSHVAAMFLTCLQKNPNLEIVDHKFMVSGHSHLECDVDHGLIEKQKKKLQVPISHPHDWYNLVRSVGKTKKFQVIELTYADFLDFASLLKTSLVLRKKDIDGNAFSWHDAKWFRYTKEFGIIKFKTTLKEEEPFQTLSLVRRNHGDDDLVPKPCYSTTLAISKEKKKDLMDLLPLISPVFHDFYKELKVTDGLRDTLLDSNYPDE